VRDIAAAELDEAHRDYLISITSFGLHRSIRGCASHNAHSTRSARCIRIPSQEHPDFDSWTTVGFMHRQLPITADEFHRNLDDDPDAAVALILEFRERERPFEVYLSDALEVVASPPRVAERRNHGIGCLLPDDVEVFATSGELRLAAGQSDADGR